MVFFQAKTAGISGSQLLANEKTHSVWIVARFFNIGRYELQRIKTERESQRSHQACKTRLGLTGVEMTCSRTLGVRAKLTYGILAWD